MKNTLIVFLLLLIFFLLFANLKPKQDVEAVIPPTPFNSQKLMDLVNKYRNERGLKSQYPIKDLCIYAYERAYETQADWSHDQFLDDHCSKTPGFDFCAENLSKGYVTEEDTLNAWDLSPKHQENLVADYTFMCIECVNGYCAQEFGK